MSLVRDKRGQTPHREEVANHREEVANPRGGSERLCIVLDQPVYIVFILSSLKDASHQELSIVSDDSVSVKKKKKGRINFMLAFV